MDICYTIIDPTKNITLLVTTPLKRSLYSMVSKALLEHEKDAEQVAFVEYDACGRPCHMEMMGGEFCGNATMSFGAWLAKTNHLSWGETVSYSLDVSGVAALIPCDITAVRYGYMGTVSMPLPESIETISLPFGRGIVDVPIIHMGGIHHIIISQSEIREKAEETLRIWGNFLGYDALGLLFFDDSTMSFTPLVYVRDTDTTVWEQGCGSGSAAIAAYLAKQKNESVCISLKQPGGTIAVVATMSGISLTSLTITGTVSILKDKKFDFQPSIQ